MPACFFRRLSLSLSLSAAKPLYKGMGMESLFKSPALIK